jgi:hypothetical protein
MRAVLANLALTGDDEIEPPEVRVAWLMCTTAYSCITQKRLNTAHCSTHMHTCAQKCLLVPLMRHQRMALAWMVKRELGSHPRGGILADDQGLGKTVSTMSLIVTNMPDPATRGVRIKPKVSAWATALCSGMN